MVNSTDGVLGARLPSVIAAQVAATSGDDEDILTVLAGNGNDYLIVTTQHLHIYKLDRVPHKQIRLAFITNLRNVVDVSITFNGFIGYVQVVTQLHPKKRMNAFLRFPDDPQDALNCLYLSKKATVENFSQVLPAIRTAIAEAKKTGVSQRPAAVVASTGAALPQVAPAKKSLWGPLFAIVAVWVVYSCAHDDKKAQPPTTPTASAPGGQYSEFLGPGSPNENPAAGAEVQLTFDRLNDAKRPAFCGSLSEHIKEQARYTFEGKPTAYTPDRAAIALQNAVANGQLFKLVSERKFGKEPLETAKFEADGQLWPTLNDMPGVEIEVGILWRQCSQTLDHLVDAGAVSADEAERATDSGNAALLRATNQIR
jgi:hypothetical protein